MVGEMTPQTPLNRSSQEIAVLPNSCTMCLLAALRSDFSMS